jgi:hypothetical protein
MMRAGHWIAAVACDEKCQPEMQVMGIIFLSPWINLYQANIYT